LPLRGRPRSRVAARSPSRPPARSLAPTLRPRRPAGAAASAAEWRRRRRRRSRLRHTPGARPRVTATICDRHDRGGRRSVQASPRQIRPARGERRTGQPSRLTDGSHRTRGLEPWEQGDRLRPPAARDHRSRPRIVTPPAPQPPERRCNAGTARTFGAGRRPATRSRRASHSVWIGARHPAAPMPGQRPRRLRARSEAMCR
jgi:hypothetical protein